MRGVKRAPLWRIFQSSSKQFQSNILWPNNNKNFYTSSHLHFKEMKSNSLVNFPKLWNIFFFCDVILSKSAWKGSKLVFHVAMVIERWTWIVKASLRWSILFWNQYLKILKFWLRWWRRQPKNGPKAPNWYFIDQCW